jgi:hypothetical protein
MQNTKKMNNCILEVSGVLDQCKMQLFIFLVFCIFGVPPPRKKMEKIYRIQGTPKGWVLQGVGC